MPQSADLYISRPMANALVLSATSTGSGVSNWHMCDGDYSTYWKPSSTADQTIVIDCGEPVDVTTLYLMIRNYSTDHGNSGTASITMSYSPDGTNWIEFATATIDNPTTQSLYRALHVAAGRSGRYWRIVIADMNTVIEVAELILSQLYTMPHGSTLPVRETMKSANQRFIDPGVSDFAADESGVFGLTWERSFTFLEAAEFDDCRFAFIQSRAMSLPIVFIEGTANADERLVRIAADLAIAVYSGEYRQVTVTFAEEMDA